ncbi:3-dehydroquinate synthase [Granulosicoccus antarcticus]|uniref:3-dehydroquinate synthase n=1 Tax=Granulosicoccus antarcticus IMCC3135 TaxID=1192854 RepID=A0A2Z2NWB9_9GAMM|nr:3-dehydroquinate synthase [Granulosicoccus antarcticus]ASJ71997.1 3-dehydroquinate synthase [Granulosicoccus antarcticus IMCC3135]
MTEELRQAHPTQTSTSWQEFSVPYRFPVSFTQDLFNPDNALFTDTLRQLEPQKRHRFVVFVDEGLAEAQPQLIASIEQYAKAHSQHLELAGKPTTVPGGETIKSDLHFVEKMQKVIVEHHIDRHSYVVGIGGGALLDAVGLVAATSHRGIRHIRIPSTVLSQNDSGVGVKNGVNLFGQKNYIGTFCPPFAVLNDYKFIEQLPYRDKVAGMAEAVKVALIRDPLFYCWLEENADRLATFDAVAMQYMIRRCAELHMAQIGQGGDPFETGSARPLDFGHWSAHRLETLTRYHLRHGEAVAIGIALDTRYSVLKGLLPEGSEERVCFLLEHFGFKLWHPALETKNSAGNLELIQGLTDFREHLGGELTITLLTALGTGIEVHEMDNALVTNAIQWLKQRYSK